VETSASAAGGGLTLFHAACLAGRRGVVMALLKGDGDGCKANVDVDLPAYVTGLSLNAICIGASDEGGDALGVCWVTGLELAAVSNHAGVCEVLLRHGALLGRALHFAILAGGVSSATCIMQNFGSFGLQASLQQAIGLHKRVANAVVDGLSPLSLAVLGNHDDIVGMLLGKLADPLQKLSGRAIRQLARRPSFTQGLTGKVSNPEHTIVQLALRLGVNRRPLLQRMIRHVQSQGRLAEWPLARDGTPCAIAKQPLVVPHGISEPVEFWDLLPQRTDQRNNAIRAQVQAIYTALVGQARRLVVSKVASSQIGGQEQDELDLIKVIQKGGSATRQSLDELMKQVANDQEGSAEQMRAALPWHVLIDQDDLDPVTVCGLIRKKMPDLVEVLLQAWHEGLGKDQQVERSRLQENGASAETLKGFDDQVNAGHFFACEQTLGIYFWVRLLCDNELEGILLKYRLHITSFEEEAVEATNKAKEKLSAGLKDAEQALRGMADTNATNSGERLLQRRGSGQMKDAQIAALQQLSAQRARVETMALSKEIIEGLGANDRVPEVFLGKRQWRSGSTTHIAGMEACTSCQFRIQTSLENLQVEDRYRSESSEEFDDYTPVASNFLSQLTALEFDAPGPSMHALASRAKYFAVRKWAATLVQRKDNLSEADRNLLWMAFCIRLWTVDERVPKKALENTAPALRDLYWYVQRAVEQLQPELVTLFGFVPSVASSADVCSKKEVRLRGGAVVKEGAQLKLPELATLTADPTLVWSRCQEQKGGVVFKVLSRTAKPTWQYSICEEEREYSFFSKGGTVLAIRRVTRGITALNLYNGIDFPSRTFGASMLLNLPVGVPEGLSNFETKLGSVILVEAEEV